MNPDLHKEMQDHDAPKTIEFQKHKGYYIIDAERIATNSQLVRVLKKYILIEFLNDFGIRHRSVMFWHASVQHEKLKIIVYDLNNDNIVMKTYDINKDSNPDWFLYDESILNQELEDFMSMFSHQEPEPKESK